MLFKGFENNNLYNFYFFDFEMISQYSSHIKPGVLEIYTGPMKSSKTKRLVARVDPLRFINGAEFIFIRPQIDTRADIIREDPLVYDRWFFVHGDEQGALISAVKPEHSLVAIDELQFFGLHIVSELEELLRKGVNVVGSGLDTNFRGEPFGQMGRLLCIADEVRKKPAVCTYIKCGLPATRTQRLIGGEPAGYNSPLILIEGVETDGKKVTYEPRCITHHIVPGKPRFI